MKFLQEPKFQPISIVLETKEEAEAMWKIVQFIASSISPSNFNNEAMKLAIDLSSKFSDEAHL